MTTRRAVVVRAAFFSSLPVLMGYIPMGIAFGLLLVTQVRGAGGWIAFLMSLTTISGSMQFAAVSILRDAAEYALPLVALLTVVINARYAVYALPLLETFRRFPWYLRAYLVFALTDETYAILVRDQKRWKRRAGLYMFCVAFLDHCYWVAGSVIGAAGGSLLFFDPSGIEFAMTALFVVILVDLLRRAENRFPAAAGGVATMLVLSGFYLWLPQHANKALFFALLLLLPILRFCPRRWEGWAK